MAVELKRIQDLPAEASPLGSATVEIEKAGHGGSFHVTLDTIADFVTNPAPPSEVSSAGNNDLVPVSVAGVPHVIKTVNLLPATTASLPVASSAAGADEIRILASGVEKRITATNLLPVIPPATGTLPEMLDPVGGEFLRVLDGATERKLTINNLLAEITVDGTLTTDASDLTSGTLADARLSANVPLLNAVENTFTGVLDASSFKRADVVIVTTGGVLQNVTASAAILNTGTLPDARLSANVPKYDAADNPFSGTVDAALYKKSGTVIVTGGGILQNVTTNADIVTAGTLADARLSANVPKLDAVENTFAGILDAQSYKRNDTVIITTGGVLQNVTTDASTVTAGTFADARLSANIPRLNAVTSAFTGAMTISGNCTALAFFTTSSRAWKSKIEPFKKSALEIIKAVEVVSFVYREDKTEAPRIGFIAEDTDKLLSGSQQKHFDMANAVGLLLKAVQELSAKIDARS